MASKTLYPPIVNSFEPAFVAGSKKELKIYFSFSSLSSGIDINNLTVHVNILKKDGTKVLNTKDGIEIDKNGQTIKRYRASGIILDLKPSTDFNTKNNYYYVTIKNEDLKSKERLSNGNYTGWIPGYIYKIQLRLSTVSYEATQQETKPLGQVEWLQMNANNFSEWSTICYAKAISNMSLQVPLFHYDSTDTQAYDQDIIHVLSSVDFSGSLQALIPESNEEFSSVSVKLYRDNDILLEDSGEIFQTGFSSSYFSYKFKTGFEEEIVYKILFDYVTENGYKPERPFVFLFQVDKGAADKVKIRLLTVEYDYENIVGECSTLDQEEDEGRIGIKLYSNSLLSYSGNLCICRSSSKDNFSIWEDIKIFTLKMQKPNDYPIIYDYTIESGVWYKYAIQSISTSGDRGVLVEMNYPVRRIFNYSYLMGQDEKQLKLQFDNTMSSFKVQILDSKTETIGSRYPYISRNANVKYKTFPINGLISFWMDENKTFLKNGKKDIYNANQIVSLYEEDNLKRNIYQYDHTYERDFRQKVLEFLCDGKPKLFKSPTEGNVIVRLMDVSCTPSQQLNKMIYSFTCNANEIDDNTIENYIKYGFFYPGAYSTDISIYNTYLGQITGPFSKTDNIFDFIYNKYDTQDKNYAGYSLNLESIKGVKITIDDPPYVIETNSNKTIVGHKFKLISGGNESEIIIYNKDGIYEFDSLLEFYTNDKLFLLEDTKYVTIDFLYNLSKKPYTERIVKERKTYQGIGQIFEEMRPGTSIYNLIYSKYHFENNTQYRVLNAVKSIEIEASPFTVFGIKDETDKIIEEHEIGATGILNLEKLNYINNLIYLGKRCPTNLYDESTVTNEIIKTNKILKDAYGNEVIIKPEADIKVTYFYTVTEGKYGA